jgi:hypothetical protein
VKIFKYNQFINESNKEYIIEEYIIEECKLILSDFIDLGTGILNVKRHLIKEGKEDVYAIEPLDVIDIQFEDFSHTELRLLLPKIDHLNEFLEEEGYFLVEVPGDWGDDIRIAGKLMRDEYKEDNLLGELKLALSKDQLLDPQLWYEKKILSEKITIDVEVGDTVYMGKFKNKKTIIKKIDKDETGMPTINAKKVVTFRIQEPKKNPNFKGYRSRFKKKKED